MTANGEDATVYVWFLCQAFVHNNLNLFMTANGADATVYVWFLCQAFVHLCQACFLCGHSDFF